MAADETNRPLKVRAAVASTLMAGLEFARDATLTLHQVALFSPVVMMDAVPNLPAAE
jgi:hypothetical protein